MSVDDAIVAAAGSRFARDTALAVCAMSGGAAGLFEWAHRNASNEADFWTKIFPKTIQKDIVVDDRRTVDDIIMELSATDNTYRAVGSAAAPPVFTPEPPVTCDPLSQAQSLAEIPVAADYEIDYGDDD